MLGVDLIIDPPTDKWEVPVLMRIKACEVRGGNEYEYECEYSKLIAFGCGNIVDR